MKFSIWGTEHEGLFNLTDLFIFSSRPLCSILSLSIPSLGDLQPQLYTPRTDTDADYLLLNRDLVCICNSASFFEVAEGCMSTNCTASDEAQGVQFFDNVCEAAGELLLFAFFHSYKTGFGICAIFSSEHMLLYIDAVTVTPDGLDDFAMPFCFSSSSIVNDLPQRHGLTWLLLGAASCDSGTELA